MQVGVYGSGYLATVVSACLADFGMPVTCFDHDTSAILRLARGEVPFHERNLGEVMRRNLRAGRLLYSTDVRSFAQKASVVFLVSEPAAYLEEAALQAAQAAPDDALLVVMTPAPVGTATRIAYRLREAGRRLEVVSQPLFLTPGCAVEDFNWPDRIVLGTDTGQAVLTLKQIYRPLVMRGVPVIVTSRETAELAREASTAFLATKVAFINELAELCEHVRADGVDLAMALGLDRKIAPRCLQPGAAYGGSFAEADLESLAALAGASGVRLRILSAAREVNRGLCERVLDKLTAMVRPPLEHKEIGILGLAFKPNTSLAGGSSSVLLARRLSAAGSRVRAYDPAAASDAKLELNGSVRYCDSAYDAAKGADALIVATAWPEFRALDFERLRQTLREPVIIDSKNLLDGARLRAMGFRYTGVGRA